MRTKESLLEENKILSHNNTVTHLALHDSVLGRVRWIRKGAYRVGYSRLTSPCGGIVMIRYQYKGQEDSVTAMYLDEFVERYSKADLKNQEAMDLSYLTEQVKHFRYKAIEEEEQEKATFDCQVGGKDYVEDLHEALEN